MTVQNYAASAKEIEAERKTAWGNSFVWQGVECRVRTKDGKFLPEVVTYFYSKDGDYQSLDYPFRSVDTLEEAIDRATAAVAKIDRSGRSSAQILADGTVDRAWENIESQH